MPGNARIRWLQRRERELLPTRYVHAVFTLPRELARLALQNKRLIYGLLFRTSAATLLEVARDPRHLGAEIGFFSVLHTWDQRLQHHPHVHSVIAAGGLAPGHSRWISSRRSFLLPVRVLGRVFRGKFIAGLRAAFREGKLDLRGHLAPLAEPRSFAAWLRLLFRHDWVVYSKRPFGGPEPHEPPTSASNGPHALACIPVLRLERLLPPLASPACTLEQHSEVCLLQRTHGSAALSVCGPRTYSPPESGE
jgi:hypothetical protein